MSHRTFNDPHGTSEAARQGLLDNRCEKGPKRHRVKGRRKRMSEAKKRRIKHYLTMQKIARTKHLVAARAYWAGLGDHP